MIASSNIINSGLMVENLNSDDGDCDKKPMTLGGYLGRMHIYVVSYNMDVKCLCYMQY